MNINESKNYCILSNSINKVLLDKFKNYPIISKMNFSDLKSKLEFFSSKRIVFNNAFYGYREEEKKEILELLKKQNIKFVLITSDIEEALYGDYIIVYDGKDIILEGVKEVVLKEEKTLKHIGYGLPFVVDLSTQLTYYDIFSKVYFNLDELVDDLWN